MVKAKYKKVETRKCTVEGCGNKLLAKGLCSKHYMQQRSTAVEGLCTVSGCTHKHYAKGMCTMHYSRFMKYGDPLKLRKIPGNGEILDVAQVMDNEI